LNEMSEVIKSTLGCTSGCRSARCGYVPNPLLSFPRRDALVDAVGRTDNPCERPARCPDSCCKPIPKFRLPKEKPPCDINFYRKEQAESKLRDYYEQRQAYLDRYCPQPNPIVIEHLIPEIPIQVEIPANKSPYDTWFLKEMPWKTNILAGFFNPDDNKPIEEIRRRKCDPFYRECGGNCNIPYPCRGVINCPKMVRVNLAAEQRLCIAPGCEKSEYLKPEYLAEQQHLRDVEALKRQQDAETKRWEMLERSGYSVPHPCCGEKLSQSPYCICNDNENFC